jgi:enamine deaminase RidA (YjgF/YER057c/UK114 family)
MSTSGAIQRFETCRRWSEAVVHNGTVYLAGQLADAPEGDIEAQTRQMLAAVENALRLAGSNKNKLLSCTIFLKSMSDYAAFNRIWDEWIHEGKCN